jgi:hypothetical protein
VKRVLSLGTNVFYWVLIGISLFVLCSCGGREGDPSGRLYQIPWPDVNGNYSLTKRFIPELINPKSFSGPSLEVLVNPIFQVGSIVSSESDRGRFIIDGDGVWVPADAVSLQATTMFAHFSELRKFDDITGVAATVGWPASVGIMTERSESDSSSGPDSRTGVPRNNAFFSSAINTIVVTPFSGVRMPISLNGGILAHEHFHKIFWKLTLSQVFNRSSGGGAVSGQGMVQSCDWSHHAQSASTAAPAAGSLSSSSPGLPMPSPLALAENSPPSFVLPSQFEVELSRNPDVLDFNLFFIRALNEGLADVWAWIYSGDGRFIEKSIYDSEIKLRSLDLPASAMWSPEKIKREYVNTLVINWRSGSKRPTASTDTSNLFYRLAPQFSRVAKAAIVAKIVELGKNPLDQGARLAVGASLIRSLPQMAQVMRSLVYIKHLEAGHVLAPIFNELISAETCSIYDRFVTLSTVSATAGSGSVSGSGGTAASSTPSVVLRPTRCGPLSQAGEVPGRRSMP